MDPENWTGSTRDAKRPMKPSRYSNGRDAKAGLDDYFRFYNTQRPHQALDYRKPAEVFKL